MSQTAKRRLPMLGLGALLLSLAVPASSAPKAADPAPPPRYGVADLGPVPNIADDTALGLNDAGQVSGWRAMPDGSVHGVVWTRGKAQDLGVPPGYHNSITHGLNGKGWTVGWAGTGDNLVDSLSTTHATAMLAGKAQDLGTLGGRNSQAFGVGDSGQVVGIAGRSDRTRHAFLWERGRMRDLGTLPGGTFSTAYALNARGHVAGFSETVGHADHAFLYHNGRMQDIGTFPDGQNSIARALNGHDDVAGSADRDGDYHAFLYRDGKMQDLGTLGVEPSGVNGINDSGQVVGASSVGQIIRHGFLWQQGRMYDLNQLIPPDRVWVVLDAHAINRSGQIACIARGRDDQLHALLLTPAAPP